MSIIAKTCDSFFKSNNVQPLCEIMYHATNQTLFSSPSLGLLKKGRAHSAVPPTCPPIAFSVSLDQTDKVAKDFFKMIYNRSIHEWQLGELESYQPVAMTKVNQIAKQLGFEGSVSISRNGVEACAQFGELPFVHAGISACKPFYRDLIGLNGLDLQQEAEGIVAHEIGHQANLVDYSFFKRPIPYLYREIEADLYALRNGGLARGLLNALKRTESLVPLEIELPLRGPDQDHPYLFERIQYLSEGLCELYPGQNQDICDVSQSVLS